MNVDVKKLLLQEGLEFVMQGKEEISLLKEDFQGLSCTEPVHYDLKITHEGQGKFTVQGVLKAHFRGHCVQCLETALIPLEASCKEVFLPQDRKRVKEDAFEAFKEEQYYYTAQTLELDKMFLDQFLPLLPLVISCREDCKGLCSSCGENLNLHICQCVQEDQKEEELSPFAALLKLKFD